MTGINEDALASSNRTLVVMFIVGICLSSLGLIFKLVRPANAEFDVRRITVIVLTMGSVLLSVFPMVVNAQVLFSEDYHVPSMSCTTALMSRIYESLYFPFVYAAGLVAMAVELLTASNRPMNEILPSALSFVYFGFPWLLGVIFVIPLIMTGIHWENKCATNFGNVRYKAHIWLCIVLPALTVILTAVILSLMILHKRGFAAISSRETISSTSTTGIKTSNSSQSFQHASSSYNLNPHFSSTMNKNNQKGSQRPLSGTYHLYEYQPNTVPSVYPTQTQSYSNNIYSSTQDQKYHEYPYEPMTIVTNPTKRHHTHHHYHHHRHQQPHHHHSIYPIPPPIPNYAPPPPGFGTPLYEYRPPTPQNPPPPTLTSASSSSSQSQQKTSPCSSHTSTSNNSNRDSGASGSSRYSQMRDFRSETKTFLKVAVVYFVCTFPYGVFHLSYFLNEHRTHMDKAVQTVLFNIIYWLTVFRWLAINIIWLLMFD